MNMVPYSLQAVLKACVLLVSLIFLGEAVTAQERLVAERPHCQFDHIQAKQLQGQTLAAALRAGRLQASSRKREPRNFTRTTIEIGAQPFPAGARSVATTYAGWEPLRVTVYTEDVYDANKYCSTAGQTRPDFQGGQISCTANDILTPEKQALLVDMMMPTALKMHEERLMVEPLAHIDVAGSTLSDPICESFTIPAEVSSNGVDDTDFVIFLAAGPVGGNTVAWAATCGYDTSKNNRPLIGVVNVKPQYIDGSDQSIRTMAHEILHALGFNEQNFVSHQLLFQAQGLRGQPASLLLASNNVLQRAKQHYGCDSLLGMEVDSSGGDGTAGSHWSARGANDELMCGYVGAAMRYSAMTIAAMEDTGFYKGNYSKAEGMAWGYNSGCGFQENACIANGVSQFPSMFCTTMDSARSPMRCTTDRMGLGNCDLSIYTSALPSYYQYFADHTWGGDFTTEYCPITRPYTNTYCSNGQLGVMPYSLLGGKSRCLDVASNSRLTDSLCAEIACDKTAQTYTVLFRGAQTAAACPVGATIDAHDSATSTFPVGSFIACPSFVSVCPDAFVVPELPDSPGTSESASASGSGDAASTGASATGVMAALCAFASFTYLFL